MKLITLLLILLSASSFAQDKLVNTYSSYFEIHGGAEDSGTSRREFYYFVASAPVQIKNMVFENKNIFLAKGDTLIITITSEIQNYPYSNTVQMDSTLYKKDENTNTFSVTKQGNIWYATPIWPYYWNRQIEYTWKKKSVVAKAKDEFDTGSTEAAP